MHIAEGVLAPEILVAGGIGAAVGVGIGLYQLDERTTVKAAVLSSALFVATLIRVPIGPSSVHLILSGLAGLLLGWRVFPAFAVALTLQALLFGIGGLSTLGVNILILGLPGLCCHYLFRSFLDTRRQRLGFPIGFATGCVAILVGVVLLAGVLVTTGEEFWPVALAVSTAHLAVMVVEGFVTGATVSFLLKVRPETLLLQRAATQVAGEVA